MLSERGFFPGEGIPKIIGTAKAGVDARMLHRWRGVAKGLQRPRGPTPSMVHTESCS